MKIEYIYDQGSSTGMEDGAILKDGIYGLIDCFGSPYVPGQTPKIRGEEIKDIILRIFYNSSKKESLENVLIMANNAVAELHRRKGISLQDQGELGGATFVFADVSSEIIRIIQGGDCIALIKTLDNVILHTKNQAFEHEKWGHRTLFPQLLRLFGDPKTAWQAYLPFLKERRKKDFNAKIAVLNGRLNLGIAQKLVILRRKVKYLLLFTDGFLPFSKIAKIKKQITQDFEEGGLRQILENTRKIQRKRTFTHIKFPEASAIAIKF